MKKTIRTLLFALAATPLAGCASDARLAEAERRIETLEWHVAAMEILLFEDFDDGIDGPARSLVRDTTRAAVLAARHLPSETAASR